jgi:hypothetical protein
VHEKTCENSSKAAYCRTSATGDSHPGEGTGVVSEDRGDENVLGGAVAFVLFDDGDYSRMERIPINKLRESAQIGCRLMTPGAPYMTWSE